MNVSQLDALYFLGDVALLGVLWHKLSDIQPSCLTVPSHLFLVLSVGC